MPRPNKPQQFHTGDKVRIGALGSHRRHFEQKMDAIVVASYAEQYGHQCGDGGDRNSYTLLLLYPNRDPATCSWYEAEDLTLIHQATPDTLSLLAVHTDSPYALGYCVGRRGR